MTPITGRSPPLPRPQTAWQVISPVTNDPGYPLKGKNRGRLDTHHRQRRSASSSRLVTHEKPQSPGDELPGHPQVGDAPGWHHEKTLVRVFFGPNFVASRAGSTSIV